MPVNIIIRNGGGKVSSEEMAEDLADRTDKAISQENYTRDKRQRAARIEADKVMGPSDHMRPASVIDIQTYMRHEQANPGCMDDPEYKRDFLRRNPDCRVG